MRFRAPKGQGAPVLRGTPLAPAKDGTYQVTDPADVDTMRALGYLDADAPAAPKSGGDEPVVRKAALAMLEALGVKLTSPSDDLIGKALGELPKMLADRLEAAETAAEERVLATLADKNGEAKKK